jgi:hypothetical protein
MITISMFPHFLTSSGTWKGSYGHARFFLVASTSLAPSALPCTLYEFALFGDPKPIVVVTCEHANDKKKRKKVTTRNHSTLNPNLGAPFALNYIGL